MSAFIRYQLHSYIQSLRLIPPAAILFVWVFILYTYKNVPILSNYGASSIALYIVMTWITMNIFNLNEESEKHILFFQLGGKVKYLVGNWYTLLTIMIPLMIIAIFYPVITTSFKGDMSIELYGVAVYCHVVFSMFGILVGTLFSATNLSEKKHAWLSAVLVIVISLSTKSIIELVPITKWILWIFPPIFKVIEHMESTDELLRTSKMMMDGIWVIIYIGICFSLLVFLFRKRES